MVIVQVTVTKESFSLFTSAKTLEFTVIAENEIPDVAVTEAYKTVILILTRQAELDHDEET